MVSINIINILIIIDKFHARVWPWLHAIMIYLVPFSNPSWANMQWCKVVLHAPGLRCSRASFWSFLSGRGFLIAASKALRQWSSGKLWQRDRINIIGLNEWRRQTKKTLPWKRIWWKMQYFLNWVLSKLSTFFQQFFKGQLRNMHFQQQQIFLIFLKFYCQI